MTGDAPDNLANEGTIPPMGGAQESTAQQSLSSAPMTPLDPNVISSSPPSSSASAVATSYEDMIKKGAGILLGALCIAGSTGAFFLYNLIRHSTEDAPLRDIRFSMALGFAWLLVGAIALVLVRKIYRWFDVSVAIVELCFAAILGVWSWHVRQEYAVSDTRFTVALFEFKDNDPSAQFYNDVYDKLFELQKQNEGRFYLHPVKFVVTEQQPSDQQNRDLANWTREYGSHMAVWVRVSRPAPQFRAELRIVPAQNFGVPVEPLFADYRYHSIELTSRDDAVDKVVDNVRYFWGVALFQRREYAQALRMFDMVPGPNPAYYAALCWFNQALSSPTGVNLAFRRAEDDVRRAVESGTNGTLEMAGYYNLLGRIHYERLRTQITPDIEAEFHTAVGQLENAVSLFNDLGVTRRSAAAKLDLSKVYYEHHSHSDLEYARKLAEQATPDLAPEDLTTAHMVLTLTLARLAFFDPQPDEDCQQSDRSGNLALGEAKKLSKQDHADLNSAIGAALGECAVRLADRGTLRRAFNLLDESLVDAQGEGYESVLIHERYGRTVKAWAGAAPGTQDRYDVLEQGADQFRQAAQGYRKFKSWAKCVDSLHSAAQCHTMQSMQSRGDARTTAVDAAIRDLTDALQIASERGIPQADLFALRASSYRQLAAFETGAKEVQRLHSLAHQDEAASKREPKLK